MCCRLKLFLEKYVRKIQDAKNPANLEVSHCFLVNQKIETGCFCLNGLISRDLLVTKFGRTILYNVSKRPINKNLKFNRANF